MTYQFMDAVTIRKEREFYGSLDDDMMRETYGSGE